MNKLKTFNMSKLNATSNVDDVVSILRNAALSDESDSNFNAIDSSFTIVFDGEKTNALYNYRLDTLHRNNLNVAGAEDKLRTGLIAKSSTNLIKSSNFLIRFLKI